MFLSQCVTASFPPERNNTQHYSSRVLILVSLDSKQENKGLTQKAAGIQWKLSAGIWQRTVGGGGGGGEAGNTATDRPGCIPGQAIRQWAGKCRLLKTDFTPQSCLYSRIILLNDTHCCSTIRERRLLRYWPGQEPELLLRIFVNWKEPSLLQWRLVLF